MEPSAVRAWFDEASEATLSVIDAIPDDAWSRPGLGDWTIHELAAHTIRAWTMVVRYLHEPVQADDPLTAEEYFCQAMSAPGVHEGVLQRGREEAAGLTDLPAAAHEAAELARAELSGASGERHVTSRFGPLTLDEYLRTRAFELTVHGIDLARAAQLPVPQGLVSCAGLAAELAARVAAARGTAIPLLLAATGRESLPRGYNVVG
ncbi:maleylpyruvate isomerase N-terminal domain-containing protein [Brevibacterium daeguense]|nr:maleylpyruvate isomerase N-terminal domain-containing protein [Brevibacterium daeguense]